MVRAAYKAVGIMAFVGEHGLSCSFGAQAFNLCDVVNLSARESDGMRISQRATAKVTQSVVELAQIACRRSGGHAALFLGKGA